MQEIAFEVIWSSCRMSPTLFFPYYEVLILAFTTWLMFYHSEYASQKQGCIHFESALFIFPKGSQSLKQEEYFQLFVFCWEHKGFPCTDKY